jgi:S1-C subfamily serine protease
MARWHLIAMLCGVVLAAGGCGGGVRPARSAAVTPGQRLQLGIVAIGARIGNASVRSSGIVIDPGAGLVLTTAHTVWGATSLKLATQLGVLHGRIVARAPCDDLALVETYPRIPGLVALPAAPAADPVRGQLLQTVGRRRTDPDAGSYSIVTIPARAVDADVTALIAPQLPQQHSAVPLDAPLVPEVAGGAALDESGRLVGMAIPRATAPGLVVPWAAIRQRLRELRPGPREIYVGWRQQYRCTAGLNAYARATYPGFRAGDARLNAPVPATRLPGTEDLDG